MATYKTYNIESDLNDQRETYLKYLLTLTLFIAIPLLSLALTIELPVFEPSILALGTLFVAYQFRRRKHPQTAAWAYLLGMLATFSTSLVQSGPSLTVYMIMLLPLVVSILLLERTGVVRLAALTCVVMFALTAAQTDVPTSVTLTGVPCIFCAIFAAAVYINAGYVKDTIYWATDIQQKDTQRAEMFYEHKVQLSDALRQLTHTKSSLETTNLKLEEAQRRAEQASKAKSIFLSNMSHELRTPLNIVIGYTSTMLDMPQLYGEDPLPPTYRRDIQLIKDSGYYLLGLINDILDLSKIEAGKLELQCSSMSLNEQFTGIIATCIGLVKDKPIQVRPDYDDKLPAVWADPMRVRQIVLNLMSNAIKFTNTGSVTLRARVVEQMVQISVIDTGIGIPEKALNAIFDRFEQAEHGTDKRYEGTGLGLDISRRLVRMHGSDLTVDSRVGYGSTFSFSLPISTESEIVQEDLTDSMDGSIRMLTPSDEDVIQSILVIEDEASLRQMMRNVLEAHGYVVVDVQDSVQALEIATNLVPDLIILDIFLPNINGWELLRTLKQQPETRTIPVIVCTASDDEERAIELGAISYLRKPFSADELLAYTQDLLPDPSGSGPSTD